MLHELLTYAIAEYADAVNAYAVDAEVLGAVAVTASMGNVARVVYAAAPCVVDVCLCGSC